MSEWAAKRFWKATAAVETDGGYKKRAEVIEMLAAYGDTDLLCYRADAPEGLVTQQAQAWDPLLAWARQTYGVEMKTAAGVMHIAQDPRNLVRLTKELEAMTSFQIAAAHDLISLSGSLIIALAVTESQLSAEQGWAASRIDEEWQFSQWGEDEDARALEAIKRQSFHDAAKFYEMSTT